MSLDTSESKRINNTYVGEKFYKRGTSVSFLNLPAKVKENKIETQTPV